jgi:hypothetical protein
LRQRPNGARVGAALIRANLDGLPRRRPLPRQRGGIPDRYDEPSSSRTTLPGSFARDRSKEIVVPIQKDLKKLVRARVQKSREAYTAARLQLLYKQQPLRTLFNAMHNGRIRMHWLSVRVEV